MSKEDIERRIECDNEIGVFIIDTSGRQFSLVGRTNVRFLMVPLIGLNKTVQKANGVRD